MIFSECPHYNRIDEIQHELNETAGHMITSQETLKWHKIIGYGIIACLITGASVLVTVMIQINTLNSSVAGLAKNFDEYATYMQKASLLEMEANLDNGARQVYVGRQVSALAAKLQQHLARYEKDKTEGIHKAEAQAELFQGIGE